VRWKLPNLVTVLSVGLILSSTAWAGRPAGPFLHGRVHDASTGKSIRGVSIMTFHDRNTQRSETKSGSSGKYSIWVAAGACVVYQAVGYRAVARRWPEDLTPRALDKSNGFELREVALEPIRERRQEDGERDEYVEYGSAASPLTWHEVDEPTAEASVPFSPHHEYVGFDTQVTSVKKVEFEDARPYGEDGKCLVWLVRYETVSIPAPDSSRSATVSLSLAYDVATGNLLCAFTDPAAIWARSPKTSAQIEWVGKLGCKFSPARFEALESTLVEVLRALWESTRVEPSKTGQIVIRPRFATCRTPSKLVGGKHVPIHAPANVWHIEMMGGVFIDRGDWQGTTIIAKYSDTERKMWSVIHTD